MLKYTKRVPRMHESVLASYVCFMEILCDNNTMRFERSFCVCGLLLICIICETDDLNSLKKLVKKYKFTIGFEISFFCCGVRITIYFGPFCSKRDI